MPHTVLHQKVENFAKWKAGFDATPDARKAAGIKSYQIFQTVDDPNTVVMLIEWDALESIDKFMQSAGLADRQRRAGVVQSFATYDTSVVLEEVERVSYS